MPCVSVAWLCRGSMGVATHQLGSASEGSWLKTTCMSALSSLVRLQARFSGRLAFLFPDLLKLLENCISQGACRARLACVAASVGLFYFGRGVCVCAFV
jgi:hypothetical protein